MQRVRRTGGHVAPVCIAYIGVYTQAAGWMIQDLTPDNGKVVFSPPKRPDQLWGLPNLLNGFFLRGSRWPRLNVTTQVHIVPTFRMVQIRLCSGHGHIHSQKNLEYT